MSHIVVETEAGQISAELGRLGVSSRVRVHAVVEVLDQPTGTMAAIAVAGRGFEWLAEEPDLYSDADLVERTG